MLMDWRKIIPETANQLKDFKAKRAKYKSSFNKYKRIIKKFYFLDAIIKPKQTNEKQEDLDLEVAVRDLFNSIGIKSVIPDREDDVDVISKFKKIKIGIEVKNGNMPSENEMFQAHKYKLRHNEVTHALVVYNNAKTNQEFDSKRIADAVNNSYGIMTTKELRSGYLKLKANKITFDEFFNQIQKFGLIKFSLRALGKSKNSEAIR